MYVCIQAEIRQPGVAVFLVYSPQSTLHNPHFTRAVSNLANLLVVSQERIQSFYFVSASNC